MSVSGVRSARRKSWRGLASCWGVLGLPLLACGLLGWAALVISTSASTRPISCATQTSEYLLQVWTLAGAASAALRAAQLGSTPLSPLSCLCHSSTAHKESSLKANPASLCELCIAPHLALSAESTHVGLQKGDEAIHLAQRCVQSGRP